jgi:regulator of protease activity HflC (stomatin/prohibitin superfamily)
VLRYGRYHRTLEPGFHWLVPFGVEKVLQDNLIVTTSNLGPQSLTTLDGVSVVVSGVVTWKVDGFEGLKTLMLEVEAHEDVMFDTAYGIIAAKVAAANFAELSTEDFANTMSIAVRRKSKRYGIEVQQVQFSDIAKCRSIRIWGQHPAPHHAG